MRIGRSIALSALMIAGGLVAPAWFGFAGHPEHQVRTSPLQTYAGRIGDVAPLGQRFYCEGPGLRQIDLALVSLKPPGLPLELVLREGDAEGRILRRVSALPDSRRARQLLSFHFDPIAESGGLWIHFEVTPADGEPWADHSAWVRFHGQIGRNDGWGDRVYETRFVQTEFRSPLDNLRGLAIACEFLSTEGGDVRLELWESGSEAAPLRDAPLPAPTVVRGGFAFFSFAPIPGSAGQEYSLRITSDAPGRFIGRGRSPTLKTLHGTPGARPGMGGMTSGGQPLPDRDLVFRAWSDYGPVRGLRVVRERAGWRFWLAVVCWTASVLALVRMLAGAGSGAAQQ